MTNITPKTIKICKIVNKDAIGLAFPISDYKYMNRTALAQLSGLSWCGNLGLIVYDEELNTREPHISFIHHRSVMFNHS